MSGNSNRARFNVLLASAVLFAQGLYGLLCCWLTNVWMPSLLSIAAIVAGVGLMLRRQWSRPLVIVIALLLIVPLLWANWRAFSAGVFQNRGPSEVLLMLLPGMFFAALAVYCCYVAIVYLRKSQLRT